MSFKFSIVFLMVLMTGFSLTYLVDEIHCYPKRGGGSRGGGYSGGGWGQPSGSNTNFGGGWRAPSNGNSGSQYSGGGWNMPSNAKSGNNGAHYSGGGWNAPSNPSNGNTGNRYTGGGWNSPSSNSNGNQYSGGGWKNPSNANVGNKNSGYSGSDAKTKKKSFIKKHWKKAAAFGAGAYIGYQLSDGIGKLFNPSIYNYNGQQYDFNTWDRNARIDGWVCRNNGDCNWLDKHLQCESRGFRMDDINGDWPWKNDLTGRCGCENGYLFDKQNGKCYQPHGLPSWIIAIIVILVFFGIIAFCTFVVLLLRL